MNNSGVSLNGQGCILNEICDTKMPIPESSALVARMNLVTDRTHNTGNNVFMHMKSISPEKAKQIKEEVLEMQKKRFKITSPRKRKSDSEKHKSSCDLKNKTQPSKCSKTSANSSSSNSFSDKKVPNMCLDKEIVRYCETAPGSGRIEFQSDKESSGEDKHVKKINVEVLSARDTVVTTSFDKNMSEHSSSVIRSNNVNVTPNEAKSIIFVDLVDEDDDNDDDDDLFQKSEKKPFISEGKTCKTSNRLSFKKEPQKVHNLNVKASKYLSDSSVTESPLNLSVKNNEVKADIPFNEKGPFVQPSNSSGNVLHETPKKAETFSVSETLSECASKVQYNQLCEASSSNKSNNIDSSNKSAGCSSYNGSAVASSIVSSQTKQFKTNEKDQQKLQTKGSIFSEDLLNEAVKLSQTISQQPKKFALNSSSTTNGLQLVMAAGGSGKKKSPRNRLGKNSPIKIFRSPYSKKLKSLQTNKQKVRKSLIFEESDQEVPASSSIVFAENYVQHFIKIIVEVLDNKQNKNLVRDELGTIEAFMQLEEDAKKLYVRMLGRKFKWHRVTDINYDEIPSVHDTFVKLECAGFVTSDFTNENLEVILNLLKVNELKEICKMLRIKATGNKPGLIQSLMGYGKNQMSVGMDSTATILWKSGLAQLGYCIKLCSTHREAIQRLLTLFSITHQDNAADRELSRLLSQMHFVESNRIVYPSYKILRTRPIFASRDDMYGYEAADKLLNDLLTNLECKNWEMVCSLGKEAEKCLIELLQDEEKSKIAKQLPLFLRRYSPGSVYAYAITKAVEGFKKKKTTVPDAVMALRNLLNQHIYSPNSRGRWFDTLALLLHSHLHNTKETAELIIEALKDDGVNEEYQHSLSTRGSRLLKVLKGNCTDLKMKLKDLLKQPMGDIPEVTIKARALGSNLPGYKKVYIEEDIGETTFSSVEELVISRYKKDFPEAIHGEGSTMCTLFALLFWDIIYHEEVPDVFQNPYQIEPLDLTSGEFYANRKEVIDKRLHDISEWSIEQLQWIVKDIFKQHEGKNSLVNWNRFRNVNQILNVIKCIGVKVLSRILERFAKHYRNVCKGFPDLILWAPARNECLFLEVKGPKDRLSMSQKIWLNKLIEFGARAEVCHVQTTGSKTLKRKSSGASPESNLHNKESELESICIELSE